MVSTNKEYIMLLEAELGKCNYRELSVAEISSFLMEYDLYRKLGLEVRDVQNDVKILIKLHNQGKTAYPAPTETTSRKFLCKTCGCIREGNTAPNQCPVCKATYSYIEYINGNPVNQASNKSVKLHSAQALNIQVPIANGHNMQSSNKHYASAYHGINGQPYDLDYNKLGSGGEGDVYCIKGDDVKVAKIYHADIVNSELENKLIYMAKNKPNSSVINQVAWPLDVIYDKSNKFCGFIMPKLSASVELGSVYTYPQIKPETKIPYNWKIRIAINICAVIDAIHSAGYVFGDFNPRNIAIDMKTGMVAFLDTDSYHIVLDEKANKAYRCKVCLDGYVAPELLRRCESFKTDAYANAPLPTFTKETDNFALAVHIFRLIMNGFTPYNGIKMTDTVSSASPGVGNQAVKRDSYCFKPGNKPQSVATPSLSEVPLKIGELFNRAFIDGKTDPKKRPSAREWYNALSDYEKNLVRCPVNPSQHQYMKGLKECPWCAADERYRIELAPPTTPIIQKPFTSLTPVVTPSKNVSSSKTGNTAATTAVQGNTGSYKTNRGGSTNRSSGTHNIPAVKINVADKATSVLFPASWIIFVINIIFCLMPFVNGGNISFSESIFYGINYKVYIISSIIAVGLLSLSYGLMLSYSGGLGYVLSWIWSMIFCVFVTSVRYTQNGYSSASASNAWKFFGIMIVVFATVIIGCNRFGVFIKKGPSTTKNKTKAKLKAFDIVFLIMMASVSFLCIPLLINLPTMYALLKSYNLIGIALWVAPVILFVMFMEQEKYGSDEILVYDWFWASMAILFEVAVLRLGTIEGGTTDSWLAIVGWLCLVIVALLFMICNTTVMGLDTIVSKVSMVSFFVFFIAGALADLSIMSKGFNALGEGLYWFAVAPAIIDVVLVSVTSIIKMVIE